MYIDVCPTKHMELIDFFLSFVASGDESQSTPKNRKNEIFNHPMTPSHANASPGPNNPHGGEENFEMGSPSWPRTPASPVFNNSHAPQTPSQEFSRSTSKVKVSVDDDDS